MSVQTRTSSEPIPGYEIQERIGAGGYGEVWKANAPGGLQKAVKFVYGFHDEDRAERELKALNRIKQVRHPFLLSLERIEVVDGQLVIVTELGDGCLKDRFEECRQKGLPGIPRDELRGYMHDAADALDYMSRQHSLQHLDIKPENLLLVGGHVKVADFGLVKDIHDVTASLMGGLTPLYAPPEVYEGKPCHRSDQYSLAIVYQEMLTGELPFPGKTAAQLASQHLYAEPRLGPLDDVDRQAVCRALNKNPDNRYGSCLEFIDAVFAKPAPPQPTSPADDACMTSHIDVLAPESNQITHVAGLDLDATVASTDSPSSARPAVVVEKGQRERSAPAPFHSNISLPAVEADVQIDDLPPVSWDSAYQLHPTLFVGLGGSGTRVLAQLAQRFTDRFGSLSAVPALQFLHIDTDPADLSKATNAVDSVPFDASQIVTIGLRKPQDYRSGSETILKWLSRRWLYNIPKSQRTEGLRPLGRLAWVDHAQKVRDHLSKMLSEMTSDDAIGKTTDVVGAPLSEMPRVVLVGASSGGTTSGAILDLGYQVREVGKELSLSSLHVTALLTHSTSRVASEKELAVVNSYALLREWSHYSKNTYPGCVAGCVGRSEQPPFDRTYFQILGDDLNDAQYLNALNQVAEQLYVTNTTSAGACADQSVDESTTDGPKLYSIGLHRMSPRDDQVLSTAGQQLCALATSRWMQGDAVDDDGQVMGEFGDQIGLTHQTVLDLVDQLVDTASEDSVAKLLANRKEEWGHKQGFNDSKALSNYADLVLRMLDLAERTDITREVPALIQSLSPHVRKAVRDKTAELSEWITGLIDNVDYRVVGAEAVAKEVLAYLKGEEEVVNDLGLQITAELTASANMLQGELFSPKKRKPSRRTIEVALDTFHSLAAQQFQIHQAQKILHALVGQVSGILNDLSIFRREVRLLEQQFCPPTEPSDELVADSPVTFEDQLQESIEGRLPKLAEEMGKECEENILAEQGGLLAVLSKGGRKRNELPAEMRQLARTILLDALDDVDVAAFLFREGSSERQMEDFLAISQPEILKAGGARRLLALAPSVASVTTIEQALAAVGKQASVTVHEDGDFVLLQHAMAASIEQVAVRIIERRIDFAEFATRLESRSDVRWTDI